VDGDFAITATASYVGGLVGYNSAGTISNSHATVDVSGVSYIGGLVGRSYLAAAPPTGKRHW